jgi:pimeloyl-ACP methyl ester carboxylesterase
MEYRGYSIFKGDTSPQNIESDAARVIQFLLANKFTSREIILFGRSIGCAVALTVTQKYAIYCTILLSPFISLKKVAKDLYCGCAGEVLKEAFDNEENCRQIQCPLLIIHGAKDTLVPFEHSLKLMSGCQSYCRLKIVENMTHTKFNFRMDFIRHMSKFLIDLE